jgi:hypothetical protein
MSDQNESEDDTPLSLWCGELNNNLNNKDSLSDGANNRDWEHTGKINYLEDNQPQILTDKQTI